MDQETNLESIQQKGEGFIPFSKTPSPPSEQEDRDEIWISSDFVPVGSLGLARFRASLAKDPKFNYNDDSLAYTIDQNGKKKLANTQELARQGYYEIHMIDLFTVLPEEATSNMKIHLWIEDGDALPDGIFEFWEPDSGYDEPEMLRKIVPNYDLIPGHENMRYDFSIPTDHVETPKGTKTVKIMLPLEMFPKIRFNFSKMQGGES